MTNEKMNEILNAIVDRPCNACKYHVNGSCSKWNCVFDEMFKERFLAKQAKEKD